MCNWGDGMGGCMCRPYRMNSKEDRKAELRMIERLEFDDGTSGYQYPEEARRNAAAGSWDMASRDVPDGIEWTCDDLDEPDSDELILVEAGTLAELYRLARVGAQYAGCSVCERVTRVG